MGLCHDLRSDLDGSPVPDEFPDFVHLGVGDRNASVRPLDNGGLIGVRLGALVENTNFALRIPFPLLQSLGVRTNL